MRSWAPVATTSWSYSTVFVVPCQSTVTVRAAGSTAVAQPRTRSAFGTHSSSGLVCRSGASSPSRTSPVKPWNTWSANGATTVIDAEDPIHRRTAR